MKRFPFFPGALKKMKTGSGVSFFLLLILFAGCSRQEEIAVPRVPASSEPLKKVLYIDSYHADFPWSRGILEGLKTGFGITGEADGIPGLYEGQVWLWAFHMDTKRNPSEEFIQKSAEKALTAIRDWSPDLVVVSDDNAARYVVQPRFIDARLPVVFCGINWDAGVYGFPASNITGMVEVALIPQLVDMLLLYAGGRRVAFLKDDTNTARREAENFEKLLGYPIDSFFPGTFDRWKADFLRLQEEADVLLVGYPAGAAGWGEDAKILKDFMLANTRIPTGAWDEWLCEMVLVTKANRAEEQGEWASGAALEILAGRSPAEIPVVRNVQAADYLNMTLAKKLNIRFPLETLETSHLVGEPEN